MPLAQLVGFRQMVFVLIIFLVSSFNPALGQESSGSRVTSFGGTYVKLRPQQQTLVRNWIVEYNKITGKKLEAEKAYNELPFSRRTTFEAVTHALLTTKLTDSKGQPMGTALDLVELVERVNGKVQEARGDLQYRIYVLLKKDAVDNLYESREFKREMDNTVYHKDYPINFRQQGGAPSIQFSIAGAGRRADIDVDYRSSTFYKALFDGHLTSANSDVRAGNNYQRHIERWDGFQNWWRNLISMLFTDEPPDNEDFSALEVSGLPRVDASKGIQEAVYDYFKAWLVERKPEVAASYISVKSFPCLPDYQENNQSASPLARVRIIKTMRDVNLAVGRVDKLNSAISPVDKFDSESKPVNHPYANLFALKHLPDNVAYEQDCRVRLGMKLARDLPKPGRSYGDFYGVIFNLRSGKGDNGTLFQLWTKEGNAWKLVSWRHENPFQHSEVPVIAADANTASPKKAPVAADEQLVRQTREFFSDWLLKQNMEAALSRFAPSSNRCADEKLGIISSKERDPQVRIREMFKAIADKAGKGNSLEDLLIAPDTSHAHVEPLDHPERRAYVMARVSDDLSRMLHCADRVLGKKFTKGHTEGDPQFALNHYETIFQMKNATEQSAALALLWEKQGGEWKIIAFDILTH